MATKKKKLAVIGGFACALAIIIGVVVWQVTKDDDEAKDVDAAPSASPMGVYSQAAISCDSPVCASIARNILEIKNGTVADAAIAALLCMGVHHSQSMGIGGGFFAVYYNRESRSSAILNAREKAPAAATQDMFEGDPDKSQRGGLAVGVPGEMKGYWELYKRYGSYNKGIGPTWSELLQPTIELCENGFVVDGHTANAFQGEREFILNETTLAEIFVDNSTGDVYKLNDTVKRPILAETLKRIAANETFGGDLLYMRDSELAQWLVEDLRNDFGGIITMEDLENYSVDMPDPIKVEVHGNLTLHTVPPPGSGVLMAFIMRLLSTYELSSDVLRQDATATRTYQLITEAFKHAYAKRTMLGDPNPDVGDNNVTAIVTKLVEDLTTNETFLAEIKALVDEKSTNQTYEYYGAEFYSPEDHGTAHLSIIDQYGNAIAVTSTVNLYFGAQIRSKRTGIIYNDEMDDFSAPNITNYFGVPPSPNNFIVPGKRPMSSMTPSIFTDSDGNVRLAVGTAGGTKITTATAYVAMRNLWFGNSIKEAIDARRIHHQLYPMELQYETGFRQTFVDAMKSIGHVMTKTSVGSSVTCGVARGENGTLYANADFRKDGSIDGF